MEKEYPLLNKSCYTENLNEGQKNWKELFSGGSLLIILWYIIMNILFIMSI